jgi:hypothetical protein
LEFGAVRTVRKGGDVGVFGEDQFLILARNRPTTLCASSIVYRLATR